MTTTNHSIKDSILEKIRNGDIAQKPRWQFILRTTMYYCGFVTVLLSSFYLISFVGLIARERELFDMLSLGPKRMHVVLSALPWMILLAFLFMSIILYLLVRRYSFVYSKSMLYAIGSLFLLVLLVAAALYSFDPKGRIPCSAIEAGFPGAEKLHMDLRPGSNPRPCRHHPIEEGMRKNMFQTSSTSPRINDSEMSVKIALVDASSKYPIRKMVGCDNSVYIEKSIPKSQQVLRGALTSLLKEPQGSYDNLYNYVATGNLLISSITITNGTAYIYFLGTLPPLNGVCDDPRFKGQIEETAKQFPSITSVKIFINGKEYVVPNGRG